MKTKSILVVVGSLRRQSLNAKLASGLEQLAPSGVSFNRAEIADLPLYNQDDDAQQAAPVKRLRAEVQAADGILFVTPEYNRSVTGVLKNAIDHASRPAGRSAWTGKPAGIVGISVGAIGTAVAQQHLRTILAALDMPTLGLPEVFLSDKSGVFDAAGNISPDAREFLRGFMEKFVDWVDKHAGGKVIAPRAPG